MRGNIVISGASTGIGRAIALDLDARGYRVFAGVRRQGDGTALRGEASEQLRPLILDVADADSIAAAAAQVEAARVSIRLIDEEPWRRERLAANCDRLRRRLVDSGVSTAPSTTHILPVVLGGNERTMAVCEDLLERGYYAQGIRHPSVPRGSARLRITPMATHEESEIDGLADAIVRSIDDQKDGRNGDRPPEPDSARVSE